MRIALVATSFYPAVDATTTTMRAVADRLVETGHDVLVVAPGPGVGSYRGARVARIQPRESTGAQVSAALDRFGPDLVHATSPGSLGRKALKHARRTGVPTLTVQQKPVSGRSEDRWLAKVARRSDRVLVTSLWMYGRMHDLGVGSALWTPGVDTAAFGPQLRDPWLHDQWAGSGGSRTVVGYVGQLDARHGVRELPEVARVPGTRLVVIGDGPDRGWLRARVPDARLSGRLETGYLTRALASLDVLVHPGRQETCSHAVREAAASGIPVVAPRAGGAPDVVRPLETGLLYDPDEPQALRRAVAAVVADRHRSQLGERARELASRRTWRDAVDELVEMHYEPLVARRPAVRAAA